MNDDVFSKLCDSFNHYKTEDNSIFTNVEPPRAWRDGEDKGATEATINGEPTNIFSTNGLFSAIELEAGYNRVVFQYKPISWKVGLWISITMLILWILAFRFTQKALYP